MRQTVPLGRIAGVPIGLHWSVAVIVILLAQVLAIVVLPAGAAGYPGAAYWLAGAGFAGLFLATIMVHELAHALTAHHYGVRVRSITLWAIGGVSELDGQPPHARAELLIALAGPAASLGAAGVCGAVAAIVNVAEGSRLLLVGFAWVAAVNLVTAVFNLLPGAPLDGGRVLAATVWWIRGDRDLSRVVAGRAGLGVGWLLVAGGVAGLVATGGLTWLWPALIGWFLITAARSEMVAAQLMRACAPLRTEQVMSSSPVCGYSGQTVTTFLGSVARRQLHDAYPIVDIDGRFAGLIVVNRLLGVPAAMRETTQLSQVMVPAARVQCVHPQTPLAEAVVAIGNQYQLVVVLSDGRPSGVLSAADVRRVLVLAQLGVHPDHTGPGTPCRTALEGNDVTRWMPPSASGS